MWKLNHAVRGAAVLCMLCACATAAAQPFTLDETIDPVQLEMHPFEPDVAPEAKGMMNITEVTQVEDTLYYFVRGVSIYSPVYVGVDTDRPEVPLQVSLHKMSWRAADRAGTTDARGHWEEGFKTETDFGLRVIAPADSVVYSILVWAGEEASFELPPVFEAQSEAASVGGFLDGPGAYLLYALLGALVLIAGYWLVKKRAAAVVLALIVSPSALAGQPASSGSSTISQMDAGGIENLGEGLESGSSSLFQLPEGNPQQLHDFVMRSITNFGAYINAARSAHDLYEASQALSSGECVPSFETDAAGMMPTGCSTEGACAQCYQRALANLNTIRRSLGRLRCIHSNTKQFKEAAVAFGDNVAGLHAVSGLAWQYERQGIIDQYEQFQESYDSKYVDLMQALQDNLQSINECENQYGMQDWYQRFGFMYLELMKEAYRRTD